MMHVLYTVELKISLNSNLCTFLSLLSAEVASAATKIQASFRGHQARRAAEKEKIETDLSEDLKKLNTDKDVSPLSHIPALYLLLLYISFFLSFFFPQVILTFIWPSSFIWNIMLLNFLFLVLILYYVTKVESTLSWVVLKFIVCEVFESEGFKWGH